MIEVDESVLFSCVVLRDVVIMMSGLHSFAFSSEVQTPNLFIIISLGLSCSGLISLGLICLGLIRSDPISLVLICSDLISLRLICSACSCRV